jgi:hypothetical protein
MKAQASAEFLVVISVLLLLFIIFYTVYMGLLGNLSISRENLAATRSATSIAAAVNYVYLAGPGASLNFTMPYRAKENITIYGLVAESNMGEGHAQAPLLLYSDDVIHISSSSFVIRNDDGVIVIE